VTVTRQEVRIECADIQFQMPNAMRRIHKTQHTQLFTYLRQPFKRDPHTRHTHDCVENSNLDFPTRTLHISHFLLERLHEPVIFDRIRVLDPRTLCGRSLSDVLNCQVASLVDSGEVQDVVAFFKRQVAQDCVHASCGIGDENNGFWRRIDQFCDRGARSVEVRRVLVPNEVVRAGFGCVLEGAESVPDGEWVGSEGACGGLGGVMC